MSPLIELIFKARTHERLGASAALEISGSFEPLKIWATGFMTGSNIAITFDPRTGEEFRLWGQGRGVVWVATLQGWGGPSRWCTILTTTNLHFQRAKPSLLWSGLCLESRIGSRLPQIPPIL